jgi:hypothetical protein
MPGPQDIGMWDSKFQMEIGNRMSWTRTICYLYIHLYPDHHKDKLFVPKVLNNKSNKLQSTVSALLNSQVSEQLHENLLYLDLKCYSYFTQTQTLQYCFPYQVQKSYLPVKLLFKKSFPKCPPFIASK